MQAHHINAERALQVRGDLAQHLVDLDHLDGSAGPVQSERLPEFIDYADMNAGLEAAAEINREFVRLPVRAGRQDALA